MRPLSRTLVRTLAPVAAAAVAVTLAAAPSSAATQTLNPGTLPQGAPVAVPHLEGKTVVDGAVRVRVKAPVVRLLGKSGSAYVVTVVDTNGRGQLLRVAADGTTTRLGKADVYGARLSGDGQTVVTPTGPLARKKSAVLARSVATGEVLGKRKFRGYVNVLDAETDRVLLGGARKTWLWTTSTDSVATVAQLYGYRGDISADVLAAYTKDPYEGGCSVVLRLSTGQQLWKSCTERVDSFNADASRMATIDILSDGLGPAYVAVRTGTGQKLAAYDVKGWFGEIGFETPTALLLDTNGKRKAATVRCTDTGCERASAVRDTDFPRVAA